MFNCKIYHRQVTPSGGTVSWNTPHLHGDLMSIRVKATTSTNTFNFKIVGQNSLTVYADDSGSSQVGEMIHVHARDSVNEILTLQLYNVRDDEIFDVELRVRAYMTHR